MGQLYTLNVPLEFQPGLASGELFFSSNTHGLTTSISNPSGSFPDLLCYHVLVPTSSDVEFVGLGYVGSASLVPAGGGAMTASVVGAIGAAVAQIGVIVTIAVLNSKLNSILTNVGNIEQHLANDNLAKLQACDKKFDRCCKRTQALISTLLTQTQSKYDDSTLRGIQARVFEEIREILRQIESFETMEPTLRFNELQAVAWLTKIKAEDGFTHESFKRFQTTLGHYLWASVVNARLAWLRLLLTKLTSHPTPQLAMERYEEDRSELDKAQELMMDFKAKFNKGEGTKSSNFVAKAFYAAVEKTSFGRIIQTN